MTERKNEAGALSLMALLWVTLIFTAGLALWGLLHRWHSLSRLQFRLDRCVGETALDFKSRLEKIEDANARISVLRAAIAAATLKPELIPPLKIALNVQFLLQEKERLSWQTKQIRVFPPCRNPKDVATPLPVLHYQRLPEDPLGKNVLQWQGTMPRQWTFALWGSPRAAAAKVWREHDNQILRAEWTSTP